MARHPLVATTAVAAGLVAADQVTKALAVSLLPGRGVTLVPGLFDLTLVYNRGAAFGLLSGLAGGNWLLVGVAVVAVGAALWLLAGPGGRRTGVRLALGLVIGGALGNLIDRLRLGMVVDFIDWHLGPYHWPAFNLADAGISVGCLYLALLLVRGRL